MDQRAVFDEAIYVASTDVHGQRAATSSNGIAWDNTRLIEDGAVVPDGSETFHLTFAGDRLGRWRPTVSAPGHKVLTSCWPASCAPDTSWSVGQWTRGPLR